MTEKPIFEIWCSECSNPINYDNSITLINRWEIETCACESDEE